MRLLPNYKTPTNRPYVVNCRLEDNLLSKPFFVSREVYEYKCKFKERVSM